jgi:Lar family restriction alleviation protein
MNTQELKPCPFCGESESPRTFEDESGYWNVVCDHTLGKGCGSIGCGADDEAEAINNWNRRATADIEQPTSATIDNVEFAVSLEQYTDSKCPPVRARLIAHIDAHCAQQVVEVERDCQKTLACSRLAIDGVIATSADLRKKLDATEKERDDLRAQLAQAPASANPCTSNTVDGQISSNVDDKRQAPASDDALCAARWRFVRSKIDFRPFMLGSLPLDESIDAAIAALTESKK